MTGTEMCGLRAMAVARGRGARAAHDVVQRSADDIMAGFVTAC